MQWCGAALFWLRFSLFVILFTLGLQHHLRIASISEQLIGRKLLWFGHPTKRPEGELIRDPLFPVSPHSWRKRTGGQLKTWAPTIRADLEPLFGQRVFGYTWWRMDWMKDYGELAQDRRAWGASVRGVVNSIDEAGSIRPGWMLPQVQLQFLIFPTES